MGFVKSIISKHKENTRTRNELCDSIIYEINSILDQADALFTDSQSFIELSKETEWLKNNKDLLFSKLEENVKSLKRTNNYKTLLKKQSELLEYSEQFEKQIRLHNIKVAKQKIESAYALIGNVEGRKLDNQQMLCIVKEAKNHLVIAGAGTGKTTTIIGKIKYLLKTETCKPEDILVLSFTNASAYEMKERIAKETSCDIEASTFHKLGLNIITKANGIVPKITSLNLRKFIKDQLFINMQSDYYLSILSSYLLYNHVVSKSEFEFKTQKEYTEYLTLNPPTTINNELVKSYGEMDIANFLSQNGIKYLYEHPYKIDTRTDKYAQYTPDFYLPEYDIYIEYFGINKSGEVPSYFKGKNGLTATQTYQKSMNWKREAHRVNNTTLIECFAYEKFEGTLLETLKENLTLNNVILKPKTSKQLWKEISNDNNSILDGIVELFETVINLIKSNNYNIDTVRKLNVGNSNVQNNSIFLSLLEPIFNAYCLYLSEHNEIDFNDMINLAKECVEHGKYKNSYKYVIVDEYQDISYARFSLLKSMRETNDFDLFCVGDDWQSIYRFAGSDIGFILNFEKYWGSTTFSKIETTYRFSQSLIEISSNFIMKNPAQIHKNIRGKKDNIGFALGEINGYTDKIAIEFMLKRIDDLPKGSEIFFIGRYSFDVNILKDNYSLKFIYNNVSGMIDIKYKSRPDLKISFLTAHKSKGLQADYVFIINNKNSKMGFPSKIQNAAILDILLNNNDYFPYSEERRLFYVALTRAKKKAFIVTVNKQISEFAIELKNTYRKQIKQEPWTCPLCGGKILRKKGQFGEFYGCSNYKTEGCKFVKKIN